MIAGPPGRGDGWVDDRLVDRGPDHERGFLGDVPDLAKVREVNAGADDPAAVHQDSEGHHGDGPLVLVDQVEELPADPFGEPEGSKRNRRGRCEEG
jgi:hypothetical protein